MKSKRVAIISAVINFMTFGNVPRHQVNSVFMQNITRLGGKQTHTEAHEQVQFKLIYGLTLRMKQPYSFLNSTYAIVSTPFLVECLITDSILISLSFFTPPTIISLRRTHSL